jgi:GntR family transcriptional repressor for pyruvate dehydrogenase complex
VTCWSRRRARVRDLTFTTRNRCIATVLSYSQTIEQLADIAPAEIALDELAPVTRRSLSDEVLDRLLELLAAGTSPTQRLLPEHALCRRLGVSRSALREARAALGHLGVVETRGKTRVGSTVAARSQLMKRAAVATSPAEQIRHALEARRLLEPPMAGLAAERATADAITRVRGFFDLMEDAAGRGEPIIDYDSGFHVSIARAAGNPTLVHMVSAIADSLASTRTLSLDTARGVDVSMAGHRAILAALVGRDAEAARAAMEQHLDDVAGLIVVSSNEQPASGAAP